MIDFMMSDFLQGFSFYTAHFWSTLGTAVDFCQEIFETTYSPACKQFFQDHVTNVPRFGENIVNTVNEQIAFNNNVDISILD